MSLLKTRFELGGSRLTDKKQKNVGLFDHYYGVFVADLNTSIAACKGRYGYGVLGSDDYVEANPNSIPAPSEFWKVVTETNTVGGKSMTTSKKMKKTVMMADGSKQSYEGDMVEVTLDVAGRALQGVFDVRTRQVNGKTVEIKNSDRTAVIPHTMLLALLEDIKESSAGATRDDGGWGTLIHTVAKDVTDPGNRAKGEAAKEEARAKKPYCPIKDNWLPKEEHGK
jgi:hypothetical protein